MRANQIEFRRVLVLSGGGAKGAYAFGCMEAFRQFGISFDAVAGTSVGALNALIWATKEFDKGLELWKNLSFSTVYPCRLPEFLPNKAKWLIGIIYGVLHMFWATLNRVPLPFPPVCLGLLQAGVLISVLGFPLLTASFILLKTTSRSVAGFGGAEALAISLTLLALLLYFWMGMVCLRARSSKGEYIFVGIVALPWTLLTFSITQWLAPNFLRSHEFSGSVLLLAVTAIILVGLYAFAAALMSQTVLSAGPLTDKIAEIVKGAKWNIPLFVTTGCLARVFDPDRGDWFTYDTDQDGCAKPWAEWRPTVEQVWIPKYHRIDTLSSPRAVQCCLASAALPLGIVSPVLIDRENHVDGGVVDNVPLFPFLEEYAASEIFVVLLESFPTKAAALRKVRLLLNRWRELDRILKVAMFEPPNPVRGISKELPYSKKNNPPVVIPFRRRVRFPRIRVFYPKESLGSFIGGTINLSRPDIYKIIRKGREDAERELGQVN
jgi:hypothetical protein